MQIVFFVFMAILTFGIIILFPIRVKGTMLADGKNRQCFFSLSLPGKNLASGKILLKDDFSVLTDVDISSLMQSEETNMEKTRFVSNLINKLHFSNFEMYVDGGIKENAFATAMTIGFFYSLAISFLTIIDKKNAKIKSTIKISPVYTEDVFEICGRFKIHITLADIIISKLQSV